MNNPLVYQGIGTYCYLVRALLRRLVAAEQMTNYGTVFRTKDGNWVEGTATISLLRDTNEGVIGALGVIMALQSPGSGEQI